MIQLPEKTRKSLDRLVKNLKTRDSVSSISLFGSWSRGDAAPSSDVDLLISDGGNFNYEYVERLEQNGTLIDLNFVPQKWITGPVPSEIDQKIYEAYILYDRDWALTNTKEHMTKSYYTPERLGIRAESYVVDADIYLSRATSAQARGDIESAKVFATISAQAILKIIIEACKQPISSSRYIETLRRAAEQLSKTSLFANYLSIASLDSLDEKTVEERLGSFKAVWDEISSFTKINAPLLNSVHFKIRTKLNYYTAPAFLQGMILRSQALINEGAYQETAHYILNVLVDMLENYAWLKAAEQNIRLDYTTLFRSLKGFKQKPSTIHKNATKALGIESLDEKHVEKTVALAKQVVLEVRGQRKALLSGVG